MFTRPLPRPHSWPHLASPTEGAGAEALSSIRWATPEWFPTSLENLFKDKNFNNLLILRLVLFSNAWKGEVGGGDSCIFAIFEFPGIQLALELKPS